MLTIPIPLMAPMILAFLGVRECLKDRRLPPHVWLLFALSIQGVIITLVQHYGVAALRPLQPLTASMIPPLAWLTFIAVNRRPLSLSLDWHHGLGPAFFLFCLLAARQWVDVALVAQFSCYGFAMLWQSRTGPDALPMANLGAGDLPIMTWRLLAISLILSAASDIAIALAFMFHMPQLKLYLIDAVSALTLLLIGVLCMPIAATETADVSDDMAPEDEPAAHNPSFDAELVSRLEKLLSQTKLYQEPGLTLARLAKRLNVPAKHLSGAINRHSGESVSRFVNGYRIREAADRIRSGQSITSAMLDSGFNTKSNFNREFLRVLGAAPSAWRDSQSQEQS